MNIIKLKEKIKSKKTPFNKILSRKDSISNAIGDILYSKKDIEKFLKTEEGKKSLIDYGVIFIDNDKIDLSSIKYPGKDYYFFKGRLASSILKLLGDTKELMSIPKAQTILKNYFIKNGYKEENIIILKKEKEEIISEKNNKKRDRKEIIEYLKTEEGIKELKLYGVIYEGNKIILKQIKSPSLYKNKIAGLKIPSLLKYLDTSDKNLVSVFHAKLIFKNFFLEIGYEEENIIL